MKNYAAGKKLAVAVSGGRDSVCLLHLVLDCKFIARENVCVINVEHGLRGEASKRDSLFVADYCATRGIKLLAFEGDVPARCKISGLSAESEARNLRREIFARVIAEGKADLVLTAHHALDNAETVLMRILRGCGLNGLRGMDVCGGGILRPLLFTPREEIDGYIDKNGIPFVTDETNTDTDYTRNFLRKEVFPLLDTRFNTAGALLALSERARADDDFINKFVDESKIQPNYGGFSVSADCFKEPALAVRWALALLRTAKIEDYDSNSVEAIIKAASLGAGKETEVGGGYRAAGGYGRVTLYKTGSKTGVEYPCKCGGFKCGGFIAEVEEATLPPKKILDEIARSSAVSKKKGAGLPLKELFIDSRAAEGAVIRTRRTGDVFRPFGGGAKKLKDYFIDKKIPLRLRDNLPLLCYNDTIIAVFGVELSYAARLTSESKSALKLTLKYDD